MLRGTLLLALAYVLTAPLIAGTILSFTITGTVDLVYDATNSYGQNPDNFPLASPISVGDSVAYTVYADQSTCATLGAAANYSDFYCSGATDGATMAFQTASGPLTFSSVGGYGLYFRLWDNLYPSVTPPNVAEDQIQFEVYSSDYPDNGSWVTNFTALKLNPPYNMIQGTGFPSYFDPSLADYKTDQLSLAIYDFNSPSGWGYLVYATPNSTPEPSSLLLVGAGVLGAIIIRKRISCQTSV